LGRRKKWPAWIVNQVKGQARIRPVTQVVQPPDGCYTFLIDSLSPLGTNIFLEVTRKRSGQLNLMVPEELRHISHAWLLKYGKVCTHLHWVPASAKGGHKPGEMRIEFGRAAGQVDQLTLELPGYLQDPFHCGPVHYYSFCGFKGQLALFIGAKSQDVNI
jgi:hypothetical protein